MAFIIKRRESIILGAAAAAMAMAGKANAQSEIPKADVPAPKLPIEKGATLRLIRPARFVEPDEFAAYARFAYAKGFLMVSSSPLTRSSYFAGDDFRRLREARDRRLRGETVSEADAVAVPAAS